MLLKLLVMCPDYDV